MEKEELSVPEMQQKIAEKKKKDLIDFVAAITAAELKFNCAIGTQSYIDAGLIKSRWMPVNKPTKS